MGFQVSIQTGSEAGAPGDWKHYPAPKSRHWCLMVSKIEMIGFACLELMAGSAMTVLGREVQQPR